MTMPPRTGSTAASCNRCNGKRGSTVISTERANLTSSEMVTEIVRLCYPCRKDADAENQAAVARRRNIDTPPTT